MKYRIDNVDYGVLKVPESNHWTPRQIEKARHRMHRFCASKAHTKARYKRAIMRFFKRLGKEHYNV